MIYFNNQGDFIVRSFFPPRKRASNSIHDESAELRITYAKEGIPLKSKSELDSKDYYFEKIN